MSDTISVIANQTQAAFAATQNGQPGIFVAQGQSAQKAVTVDSSGSGDGIVVAAYMGPDGKRLAYSVSDASLEHLSLRLVNLGDGSHVELLKAEAGELLSDFVWKPDGSSLAYMRTLPSQDDNRPYTCQVWTVPAGGGAPAQVYGDDVLQLLGWSPDGAKFYFTRRVDDNFTFSVKDLGANPPQNILLPDGFEGEQDLNVLGLTYSSGHLAYSLNASPYLENNGSTPVLVVDAASGKVINSFRSQGAATNFVFSPDLSQLAYTALTFQGGGSASAVQVSPLNGQGSRTVLPPKAGPGQYTVLAWSADSSGLFVSGGDGSVQFVNMNGGANTVVQPGQGDNPGVSVGGDSGASVFSLTGAVVNLNVPYIHQVKMVQPPFDGNWACGPAAASMIAAYYKKLAPRSDTFQGNFTEYGWYISNVFTSLATGYTFNRYEKDPNRRATPGAYGHTVQASLAYAWRIVDYFTRLGLRSTFRGSVTATQVKSYIAAGKPVLLSTNINGFGHIVCAKGFMKDGRIICNDPYWGKPGAGEIVYSWWQFRGTPWMVTIEDSPPAQGAPAPAPAPAQAQPPAQPQTFDVGSGNASLADRFKEAYSRNGGESNIGKPSGAVVSNGQRWVQNFQGGPRGEGVIVVDERHDRPNDQPVPTIQPGFAIFGSFFKTWRDTYGGPSGALGSPLSDEFFNMGNNRQQNFEGGYILLQGASDTVMGAYPWPTGFNAWKTEYYNNTGLAGQPSYVRDEPANASGGFSHDWGNSAPESGRVGIFADNFSVRFSRAVDFGSGGSYTFTVTADDGFRLMVDGQNLAGANGDAYWILTSPIPRNFSVNIGGGVHTVVLEYFDGGSGATISLDIIKQVLG